MHRLFFIAIALFLALTPVSILADETESHIDILVYFTPGSGVIDFSATYITDTQVDLNWSYCLPATGVLIRAKYGSVPSTTSDGYIVYQGSATSFSDTAMNFDETASLLYYRIWGETAPGVYSEASLTAETEGISMQLLGLIILVLGLTLGGFIKRSMTLAFAAGASWFILAAYAYTKSTATWDVYYALFFVSSFMVLACIVEAVVVRPRKEDTADMDSSLSQINPQMESYKRQWAATSIRPVGSKPRIGMRTLRPTAKTISKERRA